MGRRRHRGSGLGIVARRLLRLRPSSVGLISLVLFRRIKEMIYGEGEVGQLDTVSGSLGLRRPVLVDIWVAVSYSFQVCLSD